MSSIPYLMGWTVADQMIVDETKQLVEEGRDPQWIQSYLGKAPANKADIWEELQAAPMRADFSFHEPSELEAIRSERISAVRQHAIDYSDAVLLDRMHGAWLGRCCGCALGKPLECMMDSTNGLSSKERIKVYLQAIAPEEYPIRDYIPLASPAQDRTGMVNCPASCRENIRFMESDDDIRYTVIAQKVLLDKGAAFTTHDVMLAWINMLTYGQVCTAETQAYRNYILRYHIRTGGSPDRIGRGWPRTRIRGVSGSARKSGPIPGATQRQEIRNSRRNLRGAMRG